MRKTFLNLLHLAVGIMKAPKFKEPQIWEDVFIVGYLYYPYLIYPTSNNFWAYQYMFNDTIALEAFLQVRFWNLTQ